MPKVYKSHLHVIVEFKDGKIQDEFLLENLAIERFKYFVSLALEFGFSLVRSIRLVRAGHVLFEYRDIRSIVKQTNLLNYDSTK